MKSFDSMAARYAGHNFTMGFSLAVVLGHSGMGRLGCGLLFAFVLSANILFDGWRFGRARVGGGR